MKFVMITGPLAVGKMTIGQELERITDLKLFHNHMTIDLVSPFINYGTDEGKRLVRLFRQEIFEAVSKSDLYGMIFTYVWTFDSKDDGDYVASVCDLFESRGGETYLVELEADYDERLKRNTTPNRLAHKPTKRDVEWSQGNFLRTEARHRLNSFEGEIQHPHYLRINNTNMPPEEAARIIKDTFAL